ncbi:flippase-like domain-containing protein [bacterium]|nr:flippase-like domain-containing protein [bacterium]
MPAMLKSKKFWGIITSFLFLWLTLQNLNFEKVPSIISGLKFQYIPLMIISLILEHLTRGIRWKIILYNHPMSLKHSYFATVLGYFFNNILPARAGEFIKAYYLKKKNIAPAGEAFGTVVFERFLDGVITLGLMTFSLRHFTDNPIMKKAALTTLIFYSLILVAIAIMHFRRKSFERIAKYFFSLFPKRTAAFLNKTVKSFISGMIIVANKPTIFIKAVIWSVIAWSFTLLTTWLCLEMFGFGMNFSSVTFILVVLAIGSMIPSSPGMIGVYEWCCVLAIHKILGYSHELAATFGLVSHTVGYVWVAIAGFIILTTENLSLAELQPENQSNPTSSN